MFGRRQLPDWSPFGDLDTHNEFRRLLRRELARTGLRHDVLDDGRTVVFRRTDARIDVTGLAQQVAAAAVHDWVAAIAGHVAVALDPLALPAEPHDLRSMVRVRVTAPRVVAELGGLGLTTRTHGGLVEVVVLQTPRTVQWGERSALAALGLTDEELFLLGRANVVADGAPAVSRVDLGAGPVLVAESAGGDVATWSLVLDELVPVPPAGAVVAVPAARTMLITPLDDVGAVVRVESMIGAAVHRFTDAEVGLSPHLHLWRHGTLVEQRVRRHDDGSLELETTPELTAAVDAIGG